MLPVPCALWCPDDAVVRLDVARKEVYAGYSFVAASSAFARRRRRPTATIHRSCWSSQAALVAQTLGSL